MRQESAIMLSVDDNRIVENNHFGAPLAIYTQSQSCIRLFQWFTMIFFFASLAMVPIHVMLSTNIVDDIRTGSQRSIFGYVHILIFQGILTRDTLSIAIGFVLIQIGVWSSYRSILYDKYSRLIACEEGLLHIRWKRKNTSVQAIHWTNVKGITQDDTFGKWIFPHRCPHYLISYIHEEATKKLDLSCDCAGLHELMMEIRQL